MQTLSIFIVELQTAKRALLNNFELPDGGRRDQNATQRCRIVKNSRSLALKRAGALRFDVVLHG
jgi:hypothetical protein